MAQITLTDEQITELKRQICPPDRSAELLEVVANDLVILKRVQTEISEEHSENEAELKRLEGTEPKAPEFNSPITGQYVPAGPLEGAPVDLLLERGAEHEGVRDTNAYRRAAAIHRQTSRTGTIAHISMSLNHRIEVLGEVLA